VDATPEEWAPEEPRSVPGGKETILIVEDERQVRNVARGILSRSGYTVIEADSAEKAQLICNTYSGTIDLLLSDVVMPRMSGPELVRALIPLRPTMKILCMSGYSDDATIRHGVFAANLAFLQKPLTVQSLTRKVREVLDAPPRAAE
jgi:DNA-binding NtrC family response regulator